MFQSPSVESSFSTAEDSLVTCSRIECKEKDGGLLFFFFFFLKKEDNLSGKAANYACRHLLGKSDKNAVWWSYKE